MDDDPHVTLRIPTPPARAFDWDDYYIAVPADAVYHAIDVLRCYLAQWRPREGSDPEDRAANALTVAAAHALAGLLARPDARAPGGQAGPPPRAPGEERARLWPRLLGHRRQDQGAGHHDRGATALGASGGRTETSDELHVRTPIPHVDSPGSWDYTPVPYDVLSDAIMVLQCYVAGWNEPEDVGPDERVSTALMIATCRTLAALVAAGYARNDEDGAYALVQQIRDFFGGSAALRQLEAVRGRDVDPDIVDALVALAPRVKAKLLETAADEQRTSNGAPTG